MKIAVCTNHFAPSVGGSEIVTRKISEYLAKHHDVTVLTRRMPGRKSSDYPAINILEYIQGDSGNFLKKLNKLSPDLIFIYSDVFDFFRNLISMNLKPKIILAICGANWLYEHKTHFHLLNRRINNIKAIICHSSFDRDYKLCSSPYLIKRTHIIPNGVDLQDFDSNNIIRETLAQKYKLDTNKIWVLNVSNFFPGKGQNHLIDIIKTIGDDRLLYIQVANDIVFPIGQLLENEWKKKSSVAGIKTKLFKNLPREDVIALFKSSNILGFTTEKEVAPLVILESMASRLPWVSTNIGNAEELKGGLIVNALKDRRYYNIFDNRVINLFAQSIVRALNDPALPYEGRQQIEDVFTWEHILPQYKEVIEQ